MPCTQRACWSLVTVLSLTIAGFGCERGIILRGDMGLEINHAPPVAGRCASPGCSGHGGGFGSLGFARGPMWPAKPYRHPKFHALPIGPVFDPQVMPAAYTEEMPRQMGPKMQHQGPAVGHHGSGTRHQGSGTRQPVPEPPMGPPPPQGEMWIEPPEESTYELPEPETTSYRGPNQERGPIDRSQLQESHYQRDRVATAVQTSTAPDSGRWTRPQRLKPRYTGESRRIESRSNRHPVWSPSRHQTSQRSYR